MSAWSVYSPSMSFAGALGYVIVLWFGGRAVIADRLTLGQFVGFLVYVGMFYDPMRALHGLNQMFQAGRAAGERVFDILDAPVEVGEKQTRSHAERARARRGRISNVSGSSIGRT